MLRPAWRRLTFSLLLSLPLLLLGTSRIAAQAQATTGIIRGVVVDPNGAGVGGAVVSFHETQTNFERSLKADEGGRFAAPLLPLGNYEVTARAIGFNPVTQKGITLKVGQSVDLRLAVLPITLAAVNVEATQVLIDPTKTESADRLPVQAVAGLPNNGRNYLNLTLLTPNVAIVQGPDGDELTVAGQRGIHNNVSVDGADFNNSFFGEQRGGQRPAFTFNLDAVRELVVVAGGANAEFGRSSGGFVNVITKSGTNQLHGSLHYFGKFDAISGSPSHTPAGGGPAVTFQPDFKQHQFGFTLGGPLKQDRAFFFVAYDQQIYDDVKQKDRLTAPSPQLDSLTTFLAGRYPELANDFGPIARTNNARAALAKLDFRLSTRHNLSIKYNYTWAEQQNGTFDVDSWGASANGLEQSKSNAVNGSLISFLTSRASNEFRFQFAREDRPRPYNGPNNHLGDTTGVSSIFGTGVPFHDTDVDFGNAFRFGLPFFLPIDDDHDTRIQLLDNVSLSRGSHLFKFGGEWNRTSTTQVFVGFAGGRMAFGSVTGFINFVNQGSHYIECSDGTSGVAPGFSCAAGQSITGPVILYLQQSGVGTHTVKEAGTQTLTANEFAFYLQDTWKPTPKLTVNYGLRWEAQIQPSVITPPSTVFFAPWIDSTVNGHTFPSDGNIPSDKKMFQPRLGIAWDPQADGHQVLRLSAGLYYARIPALNLASVRSTNGSLGQTLFGSSGTVGFLPPPAFDSLLPLNTGTPFQPDVYVVDRNFKNPRTLNVTLGYERQIAADLAASISFTHARGDHMTRFVNRTDPAFGSPFSAGPTGIGRLFTIESGAKSRYNGFTVGLKRVLDPNLQFEVNYTLSFDKSDDDNERDPFTFRYARADSLEKEYNWSDRDQRHRVNAWLLTNIHGFFFNNRVSYYSAQPGSETCVANQPSGIRASSPAQRNCADGHVLLRNTIRKDNAYFSWDFRVSRAIPVGRPGQALEAILEVFNVTNNDNFKDPASGTNYLNFDGTIRSGLGDPRQLQVGLRWAF